MNKNSANHLLPPRQIKLNHKEFSIPIHLLTIIIIVLRPIRMFTNKIINSK